MKNLEPSGEAILSLLGIYKVSVLLAGGIGGTVSLRHHPAATIRNRFLIVLTSIALANYLTPPCVAYFGTEAVKLELGVAVGIGLFGMSIVDSITTLIRDTPFWKRFFSGIFNRGSIP